MSCKKHPRYTAQRKPRVDCSDCWEMYLDQEIENVKGYIEKFKCYEEGAAAAKAGLPVTSCDYAFDTASGRQWLEGYQGK